MATKAQLAKDIAKTKSDAKKAGRSAHEQALANGGTVKVGIIAQLLGKSPR